MDIENVLVKDLKGYEKNANIDVIIQRYINLKGSDADVFLIRDNKKIPWKDL